MKKFQENKKNPTIDFLIILILFLAILFFNSLKVLLEVFSYGIFKKEILTNKSKLGFDMKINMK